MAKLRTALLSAAHLLMDLTTVAFVYILIGVREFTLPEGAWYSERPAFAIAACVLVYDLLAFGLQPFIGALVDSKKRAAPLLYGSLFGAGIAALVCALCDYPQEINALSVALLALFSLCNALFHVAAGAFVIAESEKKCSPLGVFVSLGAVGVALGRLYAPALLGAAGIGLAGFGAVFLFLKTGDKVLCPHFARIAAPPYETEADILPLALLAFAVFVRGFAVPLCPRGMNCRRCSCFWRRWRLRSARRRAVFWRISPAFGRWQYACPLRLTCSHSAQIGPRYILWGSCCSIPPCP